jgi:prephenate dehydrogenase
VGAGLIGTSIGLALTAKNIPVEMVDVDSRNQGLAQDLTGSISISDPELIILATPLRALSQVINEQYALNPNSTFMDVCSVNLYKRLSLQSYR